ncbi:MAG: hypothetical protein AB1298_06685 [Bacteroidota bacterium]
MKPIKFLLLSIIITTEIFAGGGSVYTRFGIGDLRLSFSARRLAMGELGIALSDKDYLSYLNPAGWNEMRLTRFETGALYSGNQSQNSSSSVYQTNVSFNGMMFGFPIDRELGISIATGLVPVSNVGYEISQPLKEPLVDELKLSYTGQGGLSKFFIGASYRLPFDFSLGLTYDYYYGRIENTTKVEFVQGSNLRDVSFREETSYNGMGFTAGIISGDLSKHIGTNSIKDLKIGFVFSSGVPLGSDSVNNSLTTIGTITTSTGSVKTNLPLKFGIGTSFRLFENYTFITDYLFQPFSGFTVSGVKSTNLQNFYKASLGFEYRDVGTRSDSFWDHIMLRGGLSYEQLQYKINNTGLSQFSIYAGLSLPLSFDNAIDLAFQYGRRGTTDKNLLLDNIFKFSVSLSIGEIWFIRQER